MKYTVFTYGTLMKGQRNHHYLKDSSFLCDGLLEGYSLFDTPYDYPAAVKTKEKKVDGELYEIDEKTKEAMDELEETGILYDCREVTIETGSGKRKAFFYEYLKSVKDLKPYTKQGKWISEEER